MSTSSTLETLALLITRSNSEQRSAELIDWIEFDRLLLEQLAPVGQLLLDAFTLSTALDEVLTDFRLLLSIELTEPSFDRLRIKLSTELSFDRLRFKLSTEVSFDLMLSTELAELPFDRHRRLMLSNELVVLSIDRPRRRRFGVSVEPSAAVMDDEDDDLESDAAVKKATSVSNLPTSGGLSCWFVWVSAIRVLPSCS